MDKLLGAIQSLSSNENDLKQLKNLLQKEETIFLKNLSVLDEALNVLDFFDHSLGVVYILGAKIMAQKIDPQKFMNQAQKFFLACNPIQIRLATTKFSQICRRYTEFSVESNQALRAIKPLRSALRKLRPNSETLTSVHVDLVQVCILAKCYHIALPILEEEIFDVPDGKGVYPKDVLLYYYYGGLVYTGLKKYKKALDFFKVVISTPAIILSMIMVEAYKKYILISLLVHGKVPSLPKYTSSIVQRHHKTAFPQYHEFASAFQSHNTDELHHSAEANAELFQKDKNFGLVKQCIQSLYRRNIQRHTQTYVTFSLQDIATSVKLASVKEAEKQLLRMIEGGELFATVNQKDGMVSFQEDPEQYNTNKIMNHLDQQIQKAIELGKRVRSVDESIASGTQYLQKTSVASDRGRGWNEFSGMGIDSEFGEGGMGMGMGMNMAMGLGMGVGSKGALH